MIQRTHIPVRMPSFEEIAAIVALRVVLPLVVEDHADGPLAGLNWIPSLMFSWLRPLKS